MNKKPTIVSGVIGSDVHVVGNSLLNRFLSEAGYAVVPLGVLVTQEEFIDAAVETNASAILISSLYGHAEIDCQGIRDKCIEAGLEDILLFIGGNISVGKEDFEVVQDRFIKMGFNYVAPPGTMPEEVLKMIEKGLAEQNSVILKG